MEAYKELNGFNGMYKAYINDTEAKIYSVKTNKFLKAYQHKGYNKVKINGKGYRVARLIGSAFVDGYFKDAQIDHIDCNRQNDHPSNLRWVTPKKNANNPITLEHLRNAAQNRTPPPVVNNIPIVQKDLNGNIVTTFSSITEASNAGYGSTSIGKCLHNKRKTHRGFIWEKL